MNNETLQKILIAISWLSLRGFEVNKKRVQNYSGLSYVTVCKYFDSVLPSLFLLENASNFNNAYKVRPLDKKAKIYKGGHNE